MKMLSKNSTTFVTKIPSLYFSSFHKKSLPINTGIQSLLQTKKYNNILSYQGAYSFSDKADKDKDKPQTKQQKYNKLTEDMMKKPPQDDQDAASFKSDNRATKIMFAVGVALVASVYIMMQMQEKRVKSKGKRSISYYTGKADIGGQWQLLDTKGHPFGDKDLKGCYYLIYFGFTNCPDICPNSLMKIAKALEKIKKLPESSYFTLKTIFVSVDPDRDTPEKIQKFLQYFDKSIIGVTGRANSDDALRDCLRRFKIYASKVQFDDENTVKLGRKSYTIDHTILTYLISDTNQYLTFLGANLGEHELVQEIMQYILDNEKKKAKAKAKKVS